MGRIGRRRWIAHLHELAGGRCQVSVALRRHSRRLTWVTADDKTVTLKPCLVRASQS